MKALLPGSVVLFQGEVQRFGFIPLERSGRSTLRDGVRSRVTR